MKLPAALTVPVILSIIHLITVGSWAQEQAVIPPLRTSYRIADGNRRPVFELAMDEIAVTRPDGTRTKVNMAKAATAEAVRRRVVDAGKSGLKATLVLYQRNAVRDAVTRRYATCKILLKLRAGTNAKGLAAAVRAEKTETRSYAPGYVILTVSSPSDSLTTAEALRRFPGVASAEPLLARRRAKKLTPNDPYFPNQWHLRSTGQTNAAVWNDINVVSVWDNYTGAGVTVGVVDDGLQHTHPDLQTNYDANIDYDFNDLDDDAAPVLSATNDHGTAVAGLIGARGNNSLGIVGVAYESTITGLRLTGVTDITDPDEADAFAHSNNVIHIKNNSWGPPDVNLVEGPGPLALAALSNGVTVGRSGKGTVYVFAAGNGNDMGDDSNCDGYANSPYTIAVGAVDDSGFQSYYSEPGANLVVCAPSGDWVTQNKLVTTDLLGGNHGYNTNSAPDELPDRDYTKRFTGTSAAASIVSGVAALMLEANPALGWRDVQEILLCSARRNHWADPDWATNSSGLHVNHSYGAGLVDAHAAVESARHWTNLPARVSLENAQTGLSVPIPDDSINGITRTFSFTDTTVRVEHVTVHVDITHAYDEDLELLLTSPGGTVSRLAHVLPSAHIAYQFTNWTFTSVRHWGERAAGDWKVRIADRTADFAGTLNSATVTLYGSVRQGAQPVPHGHLLVSENNLPPNGAVDPGETVTLNFGLRNIGDSAANNLTATLLETGGIRSPSGPQNYGVLTASGATVTRPFTFTADGPCGSSVTALFALEDSGTNLGIIGFPVPLGSVTSLVFNSSSGITIPSSGAGVPSPSTINISGISGQVHRLTVDLNGLTHSWFNDTSTLLNDPGDLQIILEDAGAEASVNGLNLTFDGHADLFVPQSVAASGTFKPRPYYSDSAPPAAPVGEPAVVLGEFNGREMNGAWGLYVHDWVAGDSGSLSSWDLNFTVVDCTDNVFFDQATSVVSEASGVVTVAVTRTGGKEGTASVNFATGNGTALAGSDYTHTNGTLNFAVGEIFKTFVVSILDDWDLEGPEAFNVLLSNASGNTMLGTASNTQVVIADDERILQIVSAYGTPSPAAGIHTNAAGTDLTNTVSSPDTRGWTQYVCTGWTMVGNDPASGSGTNVTMKLTNSAVLTWQWNTQCWLNTQAGANGSVDKPAQWVDFGSNLVVTANPDSYYHTTNWTGDTNGCTALGGQITAPMNQARTLQANFAENLAPLGTPEWWLASHRLTNWTFAQEELRDGDGDMALAWQEYIADTIPTSDQSVLTIQSIGLEAGGCRVQWKGGVQARQFVEHRGELLSTGQQWTAILTNDPPTPLSTNVLDPTATNAMRFYRVRTVR